MTDEIRKRIEQIKSGEVPKGYVVHRKYILPENWRVVKMGKITQRVSKKNKGLEELPSYSINNQTGFIPQNEQFESSSYADLDKSEYKIVERGQFAYNPARINIGSIGLQKNVDKAIVSSLYVCFALRKEQNEVYFENWFKTYDFYKEIIRNLEGSVRQYLFYENFSNIDMQVPSIIEQENIAKILTQCDKVIDLKKQLITEEQKKKKWLLEKMLNPNSGLRLPGFSDNWSICSLSSLGRFSKGTGISNDDCSSGEIPCIKYGDIYMSYNVQFKETVSYTEEAAATESPKVRSGTLLFTGSGEDRMEIGKCTAYMGTAPIAVGGDIIIMQVDCRKVNPIFLSYQQITENLIKQKARLAQGYSIVHLYAEHIRGLQVFLPPTIKEQTAIANILSTADRKIEFLEQELEQWQQKKKSLMQLLLSGIVRV